MFDTKQYKEIEGVNKSSLKDLLDDPYLYYLVYVVKEPTVAKKFLEKKSKQFLMGDLIDAFLTNEVAISENCYISKSEAPGEKTVEVINHIFKNLPVPDPNTELSDDLKVYDAQITKALEEVDFQRNWKIETRKEKIISGGSDYFKELFHAQTKQVIGVQTYNKARLIAELMKTYYETAIWCKNDEEYTYTQLALTTDYNGLKIKGLLDRLKFTGPDSAIITDYKSSATPQQFRKSWVDYEYGDQAVFYEGLVKAEWPQITNITTNFVVGFTEAYTDSHETDPNFYPRPMVYTMQEADYAHSRESIRNKLNFRLKCEQLGWDFAKIRASA